MTKPVTPARQLRIGVTVRYSSVVLPRRTHHGRDRRARLERALLRVHGTMLAVFGLVTVTPLLEYPGVSPALWLRLVILGLYLVVVVDLQLRGERLSHLVLLLVPVFIAAGLETHPVAGDVAVGLTIGALGLSAARQLRPAGYLALMVSAGLAHLAARAAAGGDPVKALSDVVVGIGLTYAVFAFVEALHLAAERSASADAETARRRHLLEQEEAERQAIEAAGRALHDEVLVALRMIAEPTADSPRVRSTCRHAVAAIAAAGAPRTPSITVVGDRDGTGNRIPDLLSKLQERAPVEVLVHISGGDPTRVIPEGTFDAALSAAGEALRNVARHSGTATASLHATVRSDELQIDIVDHGRGVPAAFRPGYGMHNSIQVPTEQAGGRLLVLPTDGGGTTVRLHLPLPSPTREGMLALTYQQTVRATGSARPILSITWPVSLVWTYLAIRYSFSWPHPEVSLLLAASYVVVTCVVIGGIVRRAPTPTWLLAAGGTLLALDSVSLALAPPGSLLDYRSWTMGFLAVPLVGLVMVLPGRLAAAVLAPHPLLIVTATHLHPALSAGTFPWGSLNAVLTTTLAAIALGHLLRRIGRHVEDEEQEAALLGLDAARRHSADIVKTIHLNHTRRVALPWLQAIAAGDADPFIPAATQRAHLLAAEVRDDLYAPGFFDEHLRALVTDFRRRGNVLALRSGFPPGAGSPAAVAVMTHLVTNLDHGYRVTVTHARDDRHGVRFAIIPPAPHIATGLEDCRIEGDDYRTIILTPEVPDG